MLFYTEFFLLVIAVSLDGFGVGIVYGMRRIRIPFSALLIIIFCSGVLVLTSMTIGNMLTTIISIDMAEAIGGLILICIGMLGLRNDLRTKKTRNDARAMNKQSHSLQWVVILKGSGIADLDQSKSISIREAFLIGITLALDAFGAGLSASFLGYSSWLTASFIAFMSGLLVFCGVHIGLFLSNSRWVKKLKRLPSFLLIILGIYNMI